MKIKRNTSVYSIYLYATIAILTYSSCRAFADTAKESLLEYVGYGLLLGGIFLSYLNIKAHYRKKYVNKYIVLLIPLFSIGILVQDLSAKRKCILLFTMIAIIMTSVMSENFLRGFDSIRTMAYGCICGVLISIITCIVMGVSLVGESVESTFGIHWTFWGGIRDKSIATIMLAIIISLYMYSKNKGRYKFVDKVITLIAFIVIILSNSRGAWIHLTVFYFMLNYEKVKRIKQQHRFVAILIVGILCLIGAVYVYKNIILKSATYFIRYQGLINYIAMFEEDSYHMWLGNAEIAYDKGLDYVQTIRSITGWNGTLEIAWLNILIKNGIIGVIGFVIIFIRAFITAFKCDNWFYKSFHLALIVMLLVTSLVATYIQTVHALFGIYCYLLIAYFSGCEHLSNEHYKLSKRENNNGQ